LKYRYFIHLSFNGTNYHGWQHQPNGISVQSVIKKVFSIKLAENIEVIGAGRTDAGVHAKYYIAHFDSEKPDLQNNINFLYEINNFLPPDISIKKIILVSNNAHSRFSATSRTYQYFLCREKNPFSLEFSYYYNAELNVNKMNEASAILLNFTDFSSFCKSKSDTKTNLCKIYEAYWKEETGFLIFNIKANRFLRNMVRAIVGTLMEVGKEKVTITEFIDIIEKKNRSFAGMSVPSKGLFLTDIEYPEEIYKQ